MYCPQFGRFWHKYFTKLSLKNWIGVIHFKIGDEDFKKMKSRIKKQEVKEVMIALEERDFKDMEIDELSRKELIGKGLRLQKSKKLITIDTGKIEGVENVLEIIESHVNKNIKIIAIEGKSGTGKSSTTKELGRKIDGQIFSMGEIFRYVTYHFQTAKNVNLTKTLDRLCYKMNAGVLKLFDDEINISDGFAKILRDKNIEEDLPKIAALLQKDVIEFSQRHISNLKKSMSGIILIEGRSFTLDFLPSDLRVRLVVDPSIRAERRWTQKFFIDQT